jgi:hypothetical protein
MAFKTKLEAACKRGELLPVTMVASFKAIAAPQKIPSFPRFSFWALVAASLAGRTTLRDSGCRLKYSTSSSTL